MGVKEAQRGHGEVKEDEARGGIPRITLASGKQFRFNDEEGTGEKRKAWKFLLGVRRRLFRKCPSNGGTAA